MLPAPPRPVEKSSRPRERERVVLAASDMAAGVRGRKKGSENASGDSVRVCRCRAKEEERAHVDTPYLVEGLISPRANLEALYAIGVGFSKVLKAVLEGTSTHIR